MRVLLVHANPFQQVMPVPPYGLERLRSALAEDAEVKIIDPWLTAPDPLAFAKETVVSFAPDLIGLGIRVIEDCIVVDQIDGPAPAGDVHSFIPEIQALVDCLRPSGVPLVAGGAAFSYFPSELLERLGIDYGVVGAGEAAIRQIVKRIKRGQSLVGVPGLIERGSKGAPPRPELRFLSSPTVREGFYSPLHGFPVRTRIGCAMQCSYCLTANINRAHETNSIDAVLDEIEEVVSACRRRGVSARVFFADDEFNLPSVDHSVAILEGLVRRKLHRRLIWRAYFNPTPFSDTFARLIRKTNGHVSLTVDSAADPVLAKNGKPFRRVHLDQALELISRHRISSDFGFIFGLPGETEETLADSIAFIRSLPKQIEVCYSSGARVYPHTPLAALAAADPDGLLVDRDSALDRLGPAVYSSPLPPRELAQWLAGQFSDLDQVYPIGVGFKRASRAQGLAYRALAGDPADSDQAWSEALATASGGGYRQSGTDSLQMLFDLALWHERPDLLRQTAKAILKRPAQERGLSFWLRLGLLGRA